MSVRTFVKIKVVKSDSTTAMVNQALPDRPIHSNASTPCNIIPFESEK